MQKPLVSIILSTYNWEKYIKESIDSVLSQSYTFFELIIINDASQDAVESIIKDYQKIDSRVIYIKNTENLWLTKSLNKWIKAANGKYIARIDDDDIWIDIKKLQAQVNFMEKNLDYWLCWTSRINIDASWTELSQSNIRESDEDIRKNILKSNQFTHSSVIIRKSILDLVWWYYNEVFNWAEDYELWLRIWRISKLWNINQKLVAYRFIESSISNSDSLNQEILTFKIMYNNKKFYTWYYSAIILRSGYFILRILKIK